MLLITDMSTDLHNTDVSVCLSCSYQRWYLVCQMIKCSIQLLLVILKYKP